MDYSQYEPTTIWDEDSGDGFIDYSEVHARRKYDAMEAFTKTHTAGKRKIIQMRCTKGCRLAWVELTPEPVIMCWQDDKKDAELIRIRKESNIAGIEYDPKYFADFLCAGDDLDLEVKCKCGGTKVLDREAIRVAIQNGKSTLIVN
jgi:hypothetical protein